MQCSRPYRKPDESEQASSLMASPVPHVIHGTPTLDIFWHGLSEGKRICVGPGFEICRSHVIAWTRASTGAEALGRAPAKEDQAPDRMARDGCPAYVPACMSNLLIGRHHHT